MIELDNSHWTLVAYKQRMTVEDWKELLLNNKDTIIFRGNLIQLKAKKLGYGVVEVSKGIDTT